MQSKLPPGILPGRNYGRQYLVNPAPAPFDPLTYGTPSRCYDARQVGTLWKDSSMTTPVAADGDVVGAWQAAVLSDGNSYGLTLLQGGVDAIKPIYKATQMNGSAGILADGVQQYLRDSGATLMAQPRTVYMVYKMISVIANGRLMDSTSSANRQQIYTSASLGNRNVSAGSPVVTSAFSTNYEIFSVCFNGNTSTYVLKGVSGGTINPSTNANQGMTLFADRASPPTLYANVLISYVLTYAAAHSVATQQAIQSSLNTDFGTLY